MEPFNIKYPLFTVDDLIVKADKAFQSWKKVFVDDRPQVPVDSLERIKNEFFTITHITQHTTAGNASFTHPKYINKRFVLVGHRKLVA